MRVTGIAWLVAFTLFAAGIACGQTLPTAARIESVPLELTMPERYQVTEVLEPIRRVTLVAPADGFIRSMEARLGATVRESQEVAQLDRTEASARLKMATAEVKEKQADAQERTSLGIWKSTKAQLEAAAGAGRAGPARARSLHAARSVCGPAWWLCRSAPGNMSLKGTTIAELADVTSLKTLQPVDRRGVAAGAALTVQVEGQDVAGKVLAILPCPRHSSALRELATPFAAACGTSPIPRESSSPGLRVRTATDPDHADRHGPQACGQTRIGRQRRRARMVQVIRNEYVTNVPVRVLGDIGPGTRADRRPTSQCPTH